jgi:hypothetical protein
MIDKLCGEILCDFHYALVVRYYRKQNSALVSKVKSATTTLKDKEINSETLNVGGNRN